MADMYLNNIRLDAETLEDRFEKSVSINEFPFRDDPLLTDMGLKARHVNIRCYFWSDTYEAHKALLNLLKDRKAFELQHPEYGLLKGVVASVSVRHDDREKTAEIDIDFVVGTIAVLLVIVRDVGAETEKIYEDGLTDARAAFSEDAADTLGAEAAAVLEQELDPELGILEQFSALSRLAREYVKKVDSIISGIESTLTEITTPANALISTIDFAANLPGRVIGAVASVADRYSRLYDSLASAPDRFLQSYADGMAVLKASIFTESGDAETHIIKVLTSVAAGEAGYQAGQMFSNDEANRKQWRQTETVKSFSAEGEYTEPAAIGNIMNVREIESALYITRDMLQEAIDNSRKNDSLKAMARSLLNHTNKIKLELEKIMPVVLDNEMPLHLVCLKYGLNYRAAERILAINDMARPNFAKGRIDIYVR
jgi:prophage DNA circulation protein